MYFVSRITIVYGNVLSLSYAVYIIRYYDTRHDVEEQFRVVLLNVTRQLITNPGISLVLHKELIALTVGRGLTLTPIALVLLHPLLSVPVTV